MHVILLDVITVPLSYFSITCLFYSYSNRSLCVEVYNNYDWEIHVYIGPRHYTLSVLHVHNCVVSVKTHILHIFTNTSVNCETEVEF